MLIKEFFGLSSLERYTLFYKTALKVGLVEDEHYIDGIPNKGTKEDINLFYTLEDWLRYPPSRKIPKFYLKKLGIIKK